MKCPKCGVEMRVGIPRVEVSGDTSATDRTVVVRVQPLICRNKNCLYYENEVTENRIVLYEGS